MIEVETAAETIELRTGYSTLYLVVAKAGIELGLVITTAEAYLMVGL